MQLPALVQTLAFNKKDIFKITNNGVFNILNPHYLILPNATYYVSYTFYITYRNIRDLRLTIVLLFLSYILGIGLIMADNSGGNM
jgi:hypothetical protein